MFERLCTLKKRMSKPWFDKECVMKRKSYFKSKAACKLNDNSVTRLLVNTVSKEYKKIKRNAYRKARKNMHKKLKTMRKSNP